MFNIENYIERCMNSLLVQEYSNLEIILVDDGSTDGSGAICDRYAQLDARIIALHQRNQGLSAARNTALNVASGEWIGFVDGDDYIAPQMYKRLLDMVHRYHVEIAVGGIRPVEENGSSQDIGFLDGPQRKDEENKTFLFTGREAVQCCLFEFSNKKRINMGVCNKLYHKKLWEKIRFPLHKYFEDSFVTVRLMDSATSVALCTDVFYYYVQRQGSISHTPFCYLDLLDGSEDWYRYLKKKHPDLELASRYKLISLFLIFAEHIVLTGETGDTNQILSALQKKLAGYDLLSCPLSKKQRDAVQLLAKSTRAFYIAVKTSGGNRPSHHEPL